MFNEEKNLQSLNLYYNIFFSVIWNSKLVTIHVATRHSSSCRTNVHIHILSHIMPGRHFNHCICNNTTYIFFTAIPNSKLVTARVAVRFSSSCHTQVHIHVSSHVKWQQQKFQALHLYFNIYFSRWYEIQSSSQHVAARCIFALPHKCIHPRFS
jgi:hypothetical protein